MSQRKVQVISRKFIKPSCPTPSNLRVLELCLIDQYFSPAYANLTYFYPCETDGIGDVARYVAEKSRCLQKSLSDTLVEFYPMAGRLKDTSCIDCNDEGAVFFEGRIGCSLGEFLGRPNAKLLAQFLPTSDPNNNVLVASGCMLLVQLTTFDCGGMAICICSSHAIADAYSLTTIMKAWVAKFRGNGALVIPKFIGGSLLPPTDSPYTISYPPRNILTSKSVTNRIVFGGSRIDALRAKISGEVVKHYPSRVTTVLALILKCAICASRSVTGSFRTAALFQLANFRMKLEPPLQEYVMGNYILMYSVLFEDHKLDMNDMVTKMREGLRSFYNEKLSKISGNEGCEVVTKAFMERAELMMNQDIIIYKSSSVCGTPLYDVDFGWGEPAWVTSLVFYNNQIVFSDTKYGGGIEAWITLEEQEMALFERDPELLEFAAVNPSIFAPHARM